MAEIENPHVLLVDDVEMIVNAWQQLLENEGFRVSVAMSGKEAIQRLQDRPSIDVALLDYRLPDISGLEVLGWIRSNELHANKSVIMTTASILHGEECLDYGADYFLPKPIDLEELVSTILSEVAANETDV